MSIALSQVRRPATAYTRVAPDRRRHKRFAIAVLGRFMRASKQEYPCKLNDISVGGASMMSPVPVYIGEKIIAYLDQIGGIEGTVVRVFEGGFAIRISASQHKREKLAAQITWLVNKDKLTGVESRRHERNTRVPPKASVLTLAEGITTDCRILDISLSGASIETEARPPLGNEVMLGKLRCRVMRHHDQGVGVQFLDIQDPDALRRYFG
ncbi:MAG: PilZ domain-containing protein [Hyphomicrobium sp.]